MVNYDLGIIEFRHGKYRVWAHELFGSPAYILAVAEVEKGNWKLESVVRHFLKHSNLSYERESTEENIDAIIKKGKRFLDDPSYLTTGALPY